MATSYEEIFNKFKKRIEDRELASFTPNEQEELMTEWLDSAIGYIELDDLKLKHDLSLRDNDYQEFEEDLTNAEMEVIAMYMVTAWYEPKINSLQATLMFIGSKDEKWTSQKDHLAMMIGNRDKWKLEARKYFRNYCYKNNSYLDGEE